MDLDSQSNLSLFSVEEDELGKIWQAEDEVIDNGIKSIVEEEFLELFKSTRTIHFLLKTVEEGFSDVETLPPPCQLAKNLDLIPSRLTLFAYENKVSERWSGMFLGESLSIRTVTRIRQLAELYSKQNGYEFVIIDTSPSLGALNKVIISTVDGFIIPCLPDLFSLYGIKNIGKALTQWKREFDTCAQIVPEDKRKAFPKNFVRFLGYITYNAKKRSDSGIEKLQLATAHYNYAKEIPDYIKKYIGEDVREHLTEVDVNNPIGNNEIIHTHNTLPNMAQKYHKPMWLLPDHDKLEPSDKSTISGNSADYKGTKDKYEKFAESFLDRVKTLDSDDKK